LIEEFQLGEAGRQINEFFWSDYCDWYVESAKVQMQGDSESRSTTAGILRAVLDQSMRLLHPFMPFVTEEVWQYLYRTSEPHEHAWPVSALIVAPWPQFNIAALDEQAEQEFGLVQEVITRIRDARNQMNVEPARRVPAIIAAGSDLPMLEAQTPLIEFLARTESPQLHAQLAEKPQQAMALLAGPIEIYLPLSGLLDLAKERDRLAKEIAQATQGKTYIGPQQGLSDRGACQALRITRSTTPPPNLAEFSALLALLGPGAAFDNVLGFAHASWDAFTPRAAR